MKKGAGSAKSESAPLQSESATAAEETSARASGASADALPESSEQDRSPDAENLPMSGIRVIDVGTFLAGPYAASMLGEFGAEILKVEHPINGDPMRRFGTPSKRHDATLAWLSEGPVSYTHLDVYKRQVYDQTRITLFAGRVGAVIVNPVGVEG